MKMISIWGNFTIAKDIRRKGKAETLAFSPYLPGRMVVPPSVEFELYEEAPGCLPPLCYWLCSTQREPPPGRGFPDASPASQQTNNRKNKEVTVKDQ